ncbi:MAG: ribosome maturation factor RimP [Thermodesulfobacteriota bacterium]
MHSEELINTLEGLVAPLAEQHGLTLWGLEFASGPGRGVLRIFVDAPEGVTVDQCARLSRDLSVLLDVEDPIPGRYSLEVSSPGLDRVFFRPEQMEAYLGQEVSLSLREPEAGRRSLRGALLRVEGSTVVLDEDGTEQAVDFSHVKRAQLRYAHPAPAKPGKGGK